MDVPQSRLYDEVRRRVSELETLRSISLQLTSSLDLPTVLDSIAENTIALVGATDCLIYLYDATSESFRFGTALGRWAAADSVLLPRSDGLTATVIREGRPVVINDAATHPLYVAGEAQRWGIQAIAGFPLQRSGQALGVLEVAYAEPHVFVEKELRLLDLLADQAVIAIANARLFEAAGLQLQELQVLHTVATICAEATSEDELIERVTRVIGEALYPDVFGVMLVDQEAGTVSAHPSYQEEERAKGMSISLGQGITGTVAASGHPWRVGDVSREPAYIEAWAGTRSELCVPLKMGERVIGVINAESKQWHAFSKEDERLLATVAGQLATAIEKVRLYQAAQLEIAERARAEGELRRHRDHLEELVEERTAALRETNVRLQQEVAERVEAQGERERLLAAERRRADELDALRATMAEITAELELSSLLQAIVERATVLLDATGGELGLYEPASGEVRIVVSHNLGADYVGVRHARGEGAMGQVAESGEALIVEDYRAWAGRAPQYAGLPLCATMLVPLEVAGRLVGVISMAAFDPSRKFGPPDLHLLGLFAQQAAIAIENARLFGERERRVAELATLTDIGQALSSTLRVDEVLELIYEQTRRVMYAEDMVIILHDEERHQVECAFSTNPHDMAPGVCHPDDVGLTGHIIQHHRSILLRDAVDESIRGLGLEIVGQASMSWLGVPILRGERVLGVIVVQHYTTPNVYDESDRVLLETIASQAATAIENARLYDQAQREIAERTRAEAELRTTQEHLEELVQARTTALRESRERYRTLFDGVPVGLYRTTPAGQFVEANLALVQMMGYPSREELLAANVTDLYLDPKDRARLRELVEQKGVLRDFEARLVRHNGTVIWGSLTLRAVQDERGQALYYEGSLEDITERKRAEAEIGRYQMHLEDLVEERTAELRESEERYRTLFDGVPVGLYRTTPEGRVLNANRAAAQMFGFPHREDMLVASAPEYFVNDQERSRWQALMEREGVVRDFEERLRRYDGTVIWVSDTAHAVKDEQGHVLYYEGSIEDISERKRIEGELRRQKEYYEALFVNNPVAVVTADLDGRVVSWNPAAERLFGYSSEEAIGRDLDDLVANDPRVRQEAQSYTEEVLGTGRAQATTRRTRKDGSLVDVELLALPVTVGDQRLGFIVIYIDITDLQQARRAAEMASQAKSRFLANISHELRTPLNAILGFTQLMDGKPNLTSDQRENLSIINRSGEHLLALINDVLEMSKIEAGQATLEETSFDLYSLLDSLQELFCLRAQAKGLDLNLERAENVPRYVQADEGKLRQVLSNLLGNACKFTREGHITLRVWVGGSEHPPITLYFEVEDTGPGIAPEELSAVFDAFVQTETGRSSQEGTGLGLPISQQYVRLMGGNLTVRSKSGRGSVFAFAVPVDPADATRVQAQESTRRVLGLEPRQRAPDGGPYRLLVVDDRDTDRRLFMRVLADLDQGGGSLEVREAANGQQAVEMWERWRPHLIWMDMRMPVLDGHQATRRIKAHPQGQDTVIVALTATAFEEDRQRILLNGCDDFVRKPFRRSEIYDALARHLKLRFLYEAEQPQPAGPCPAAAAFPEELLRATSLPDGWVPEMQQAVVQADLERILALIDRIQARNPELAEVLTELARNFDYNGIRALLVRVGGEQ
jgi:PAS domain S-box-containing protein